MTIEISFNVPKEIMNNATIKKHLWNIGYFVRDLWLAKSPYAGGSYAAGLARPGSVTVKGNRIVVTNFCRHAQYVEYGHRAFNIGLAMLNNGRNVKTSADGNRYKKVKIDPSPTSRYRKETVATNIKQKFARIAPIGMKLPKIDRYGVVPAYKTRQTLLKPLKPGPVRKTPRGIFTISERAIREDPSKWLVPVMEARHLGKNVQQEAKPYVVQTLRDIVQAERARQQRVRGKNPKWYKPRMTRGIIKVEPVRRK